MSVMNNPEAAHGTWEGEVELDLGDLGFQWANLYIEFAEYNGSWGFGTYKLTAFEHSKKYLKDGKPFHEHCIVDLTDDVSEQVVADLFDQYIVQGG